MIKDLYMFSTDAISFFVGIYSNNIYSLLVESLDAEPIDTEGNLHM
jgi:hypothetical protein